MDTHTCVHVLRWAGHYGTDNHAAGILYDLSSLPRYLENWEGFRSAFTVTFALVVLLLVLCVGGAMGRGLVNVSSIYRYGEDTSYIEGAHQAGTMLKKSVCNNMVLQITCNYVISVQLSALDIAWQLCI